MKLIVGLGNPTAQYAQTRHNVGWLVVDELARRAGAVWRKEGEAEVCELRLGTPAEKVLLLKPQTYMNSSGKAVLPAVQFYKLEAEQLLVVQDDLDSPFGLLKLRSNGRHGGQNGVRDIIRLLGHEQFPRLKIGISRPPAGWTVEGWVLSKWQPQEAATLAELVRLGADAAALWGTAGLLEAQSKFNGTDLRPPSPVIAPQEAQEALSASESEGTLK